MPLVSPAFQFPSDWNPRRPSVGLLRDGDSLRIWLQPRNGKGSPAVVSKEEWMSDSCPVRDQVEAYRDNGGWLVAGLSPNRGLVRECRSPLSSLEKSGEIWPSLLEATLPFPLEDCAVAFLPPVVDPEGGSRCLAAAARTADIEDALAEWAELGIEPDLLVPEVLLLSDPQESMVWVGNSRSVFTAWHEHHFLGAGGCRGIPPSAKPLSRFKTAWSNEVPGMQWREVGPSTGEEEHLLEKHAASAPLLKTSCFVNLLENREHSRLQSRLKQKKRSLAILAGLLIVLLAAFPLIIQGVLRAAQADVAERIQLNYQRITGEESPAPGQEVLLAGRFVDETMTEVSRARAEVSGPHATTRLQRVLRELDSRSLIATRLEADPVRLTAEVLGTEEELSAMKLALESYGEQALVSPTDHGTWLLEVRSL